MAEQRLIDANALLDKQESLYMKGHVLFHGVTAYAIENAPTIDPEALPIVRQLRAELARVTAERDAAVEQLSELECCEFCEYTGGIPRGGVGKCEWRWRGPRKEE